MPIICPHCQTEKGFFVKEQVRGTATPHYTKNGDYAKENSHLYSHVTHSGGKQAFCLGCGGYIGKSKDLISGKEEK